jgi:hypothetical protein
MRIRTKQAVAIGGFVAVLGLAYVLLSTNYGDEVFPGYDQSHLHKCTRNPLLTYPITDRLFEQHDARSAQFMQRQLKYLSRYITDATARGSPGALPQLARTHNDADRMGPQGLLRGNASIESLQPALARRWELLGPAGGCPLKKFGKGKRDGVKYICGPHSLFQPGCLVYSIGSNNNFDFETSVLEKTPCAVHVFDCTVREWEMEDYPTVEKHLNERIFLHKWCLGEEDAQLGGRQFYTYDTIFSKLGHTTVELLKMDIEGYEWDVYNSFQPSNQDLPFQISTELHLTAFWNSADLWWAGRIMSAGEVAGWGKRFYDLGYRIVSIDGTERWPQAKEVTFVRFYC